MDFKEAERKYYRVADVLKPLDRVNYACGRPTRDARNAMFLWWANREGLYGVSDAFQELFLGPKMTRNLVRRQTGRKNWSFKGFPRRKWNDGRPDVDIAVLCHLCGYDGTVKAKSKMDAVCKCGSVRLEYK